MTSSGSGPARRLRIAHLFPDLLSVYGDAGNIRSIVTRAECRRIIVEVDVVRVGDRAVPDADVFLIGGGQDREQRLAATELERLGPAIQSRITDGAALVAVCGGYQLLGRTYRTGLGTSIPGAHILPLETVASGERLVGPVIATLGPANLFDGLRRTVVGFENHSGRTILDPGTAPLASVEIGHGNNDVDGGEGIVQAPGNGGMGGLRIGTYLHGPLLPRNPHLADGIIRAALAHGGRETDLEPLDDTVEWRAHDHYASRVRALHRRGERLPASLRRIVDPARGLIGY